MNEHILLVDDDEYIRLGLNQMLGMEGYTVACAQDGTQGIERFHQESFDLVITDIKMPGMDGMGLLGLLHEQAPDLPVILITGHGELNTAIEALRAGAYDFITKPFQDEVVLASIHRALEKTFLQKELLTAQKLAGIGTLAAGIAHELNTPLNAIIGSTERLLKQLPAAAPDPSSQTTNSAYGEHETMHKYLELIQRNGLRCARIVQALKTYARKDPLELQEWNLNDILTDSLVLIEQTLRVNLHITIETDLSPDLPRLRCDRNKLSQVFINLLSNSSDAMPFGGHIHLATRLSADGQSLVATVSDEGCGIPTEVQARIFDPFFTTKPVGQGIGLGLSIVAGILHEHQGSIRVESQPDQGTTFTIELPLFQDRDHPVPIVPTLGRYDEDSKSPARESDIHQE